MHIRQLSFAGFAGFVAAFFRLFRNYIFLCAAKISSCNILSLLFTSFFVPIRWYLKPLKGRIKKKKDFARLQARVSSSHSSRQLGVVVPPPKQLETRTIEPARRLVYRLSRDSRYL